MSFSVAQPEPIRQEGFEQPLGQADVCPRPEPPKTIRNPRAPIPQPWTPKLSTLNPKLHFETQGPLPRRAMTQVSQALVTLCFL